MSYPLKDKRKEPRVSVRFQATLCWTDVSDQEVIENAHTFSISNTGAGLKTRTAIPIGQKIRLSLNVGGPSGSSWAVIRWAEAVEDGYIVGVSFQS